MSVFQLFFTYISDLVSPYAWNITRAVWPSTGNSGTFSIAGQDTAPTGLFFKPDGTKMYMLGDVGIDINEYVLSTPWDVTTATFVIAKSQDSPTDSNPTGIFFKSDGLALYLIGNTNDYVNQYTLTSAWDITTASYVQRYSINAQEIASESVHFSTDGTKMYVIGTGGDDVNEYTLSTAWNVLTASYTRVFSVAAQETNPKTLFFKPDGTKMYVSGNTRKIYEYTLTTPWDVSSASYTQSSVDLNEHISLTVEEIFFKPDGTEMYVVSNLTDIVCTFIVQTPWDVSTLSLKRPSHFASLARQFSDAHDVFFHPDGTKMYAIGQVSDAVAYYELAEPWSIGTSRYVTEFSIESQETTPTGLFFKPDGTKMYVVGSSSDRVHEYTLTTSWNISTATYVQNFSVSLQEATPNALAFSSDGFKLYILGSSGDDVNEYVLNTAWDISTASFVQLFSIAGQETTPTGMFFKPDGTKMYLVGSTGDDVNEYLLTTAWNISSAVYVQNFSVAAQETSPTGIFFKPDGTRMYITGSSSDAVYEYVIE